MLRKVIGTHCRNVLKFTRSLWTVSTSDGNVCLDNDVNKSRSEQLRFPYVWLRDNCQCPLCFHERSKSRTIHINEFNFDAVPSKTSVTEKNLEIEWDDKHVSKFKLDWLAERQFKEEKQLQWKQSVYKDEKVTWKANDFDRMLKRYSFDAVMQSDEELLSWLESLSVLGISILEEAGKKEGQVKNLAKRIAFLKETQYGDVFRVEEKADTTNVAYLNGPLQLHTDLPYYQYKPGVNLLHYIVQGEGGENQLADCLAAAAELRRNHPILYNVLKETDVVWSDQCYEGGCHYHSIYLAPVICEDSSGRIERFNFSQPQRDSQFNVPLDTVKYWYTALREFSRLLYSPEYFVNFRMRAGDVLTFDNLRLVHGRINYKGPRCVEGTHVDWDQIYSRIRILRSQTSQICKQSQQIRN